MDTILQEEILLLRIFSSEFHRAKLRVSSSEILLVEGYLGSLN